jgi:hypothetical protein
MQIKINSNYNGDETRIELGYKGVGILAELARDGISTGARESGGILEYWRALVSCRP